MNVVHAWKLKERSGSLVTAKVRNFSKFTRQQIHLEDNVGLINDLSMYPKV